ncbi:MAG: chromate transporter [Candidatus Korobacteraceae bacterium]|jgi:chromate transporter
MKNHVLWQIALTFASLSLVAMGGANAVVPEIHRQVVGAHGWMNDATFAQLFAIAQAAPGPNILLVSLIGWRVAGMTGLAVATLAMIVPSSVLAFTVGRLVNRLADAPWISLTKAGLVPVAVGLIMAGGMVMARAAVHNLFSLGITIGAAIFVLFSGRNPLWALAGGTIISLLGLWLGLVK